LQAKFSVGSELWITLSRLTMNQKKYLWVDRFWGRDVTLCLDKMNWGAKNL